MNYLGHSLFSKDKDFLFTTGNILGDFYKGRPEKLQYPPELINGIIYHRYLDKTTDENPVIIQLKNSLTNCGLFKGAIIDMFLDYFLAKNWNMFNSETLASHSEDSFNKINASYDFLTTDAKKTFFYLKKENWMLNYKNIDFIEEVLYRMGTHYKKGYILQESISYLKKNPNFYEDNFYIFIDNMLKNLTKKSDS